MRDIIAVVIFEKILEFINCVRSNWYMKSESVIIFSGLKGKGHKAGTTYVSGFGVHHPGGIILANGERKVLKEKNIWREIVISY